MMIAFTGPDSLRLESATVEVPHLYLVGTIPGVIPLLAAARNGPGSGRLASSRDGKSFQWRAPGSIVFGAAIRGVADGNYLIRDGEDSDKWIRIQVDASELASGARTAVVNLTDRYNNAVAGDDITSAQAAAGNVETYTVNLKNQSTNILSRLTIWINHGVTGIEISDDSGGPWITPKSETTGLVLPDLLPGVSDTLHVRRTITAGASADGNILTHLHSKYRG